MCRHPSPLPTKLDDASKLKINFRERKVLKHLQLINEVISQLAGQFNADGVFVKRRIEELINREYLARVENAEVPTYKYLA